MNLHNYRPTPPLQFVGTIEGYHASHHPADGGSGYYSADAAGDPTQAAVNAARNALATLTGKTPALKATAQSRKSQYDSTVALLPSVTQDIATAQADYDNINATWHPDKKQLALANLAHKKARLTALNRDIATAKGLLDAANADITQNASDISYANDELKNAIDAATGAIHSSTEYQTQEQKRLATAALEKIKSDAQKATDKAKMDADAAVAKSRIDAQSAKDAATSKNITIGLLILGVIATAFGIYKIVTREKGGATIQPPV